MAADAVAGAAAPSRWPAVRAAVLAAVLQAMAGAVPAHLRPNMPSAATRPPWIGKHVAEVSAIYEISVAETEGFAMRPRKRLAEALGVSVQSIELTMVEKLLPKSQPCVPGTLVCAYDDSPNSPVVEAPGIGGALPTGTLYYSDPKLCRAAPHLARPPPPPPPPGIGDAPSPAPQWQPWWDRFDKNGFEIEECTNKALATTKPNLPFSRCENFEEYVWEDALCVSNKNTTLMLYPLVLENVYVTGWRAEMNDKIRSNPTYGLEFELHIVGRITIMMALYLQRKFVLNSTIPMPEISPEVFDDTATHTGYLNFRSKIFAIRQGDTRAFENNEMVDELSICKDPPVPMLGCFRIDFNVYSDHYTEYHLRYMIRENGWKLAQTASDPPYPYGDFNMSAGPWPSLTMVGEFGWKPVPGPWQRKNFPQIEWRDTPNCRSGEPCPDMPIAPSARYLHSAVMYKTWSFEKHARTFLCNQKTECGPTCLSNLSCLGGMTYFDDFFYFRSAWFLADDGGDVPFMGIDHFQCPDNCCRDRRMCMRQRDVLGYLIPYDAPTLLVFGGRTYENKRDPLTGELIYHYCERINRKRLLKEWRGCGEVLTNDLWRYDIVRSSWQFLKPGSAIDPTTQKPVGYPLARYAHAATIVEVEEGNDVVFKKIFMYMFGGIGNMCPGGVCNDHWKYEIPFAAQAYYPKFPGAAWDRGNIWYKLRNCPFGGRYRHQMVTNSRHEYIYIFGGQEIGRFSHQLLRYRISTDVWEDMEPFGRTSLTRMMYDHMGRARIMTLNPSEYDEKIDVDCRNAWRFDGRYAHCRMCRNCRMAIGEREDAPLGVPDERGDFSFMPFLDDGVGSTDDRYMLFGGFRTTWGIQRNRDEMCKITTTAAPVGVILTSTTAPPVRPPEWAEDAGPAPPPPGSISEMDTLEFPPTTILTTTTTTEERSILDGVQEDVTVIESKGEVEDGNPAPFDRVRDKTPNGLPSKSTEGVATPPRPSWPTDPPSTATTTTNTNPTTTTNTTSTSSTNTDTSSTHTTTSLDESVTFITTTATTATTLSGQEGGVTEMTTTTSTTTITMTTTTTLIYERPVVSGSFDDDFVAVQQNREIQTDTFTTQEGPCTNGQVAKYYFNDVWIFESSVNQWVERPIMGDLPTPRRGHQIVTRRERTTDTQVIMIGGHNQDDVFSDMWVLNLMREDPAERVWTRIDPYFTGNKPPALSHHTMVFSEDLKQIIIFGGITWNSTDKLESDRLRNIDRRCLKEAQGLPEQYDGMQEGEFLTKMRKLCLADNVQFCCAISQNAAEGEPFYPPPEFLDETRIRTDDGYLNLTALSIYCREACEEKAFVTEFHPEMVEGVFSFNIDKCQRDCSGNGYCDMSQCVCKPDYYGVDCSMKRCVGSMCYTHPQTKEQFCVECSQHGTCVSGTCECYPGWALDDCSAPKCEDNCSSTPEISRGICVEDFPVHTCTCLGRWSGRTCSDLLCLNDCSNHGRCLDGNCICEGPWYGDDCSLFAFEPK